MAKRFTDTEKYKKPFFKSLKGPYKLLWDFLYHNCDNAGIWIKDFDVVQIYLGPDMKVTEQEAIKIFGDKIVIFDKGNKWWIPGFIEFQYDCKVEELNPKNNAHLSVIKNLKREGLLGGAHRATQDKDKDKDKDKDSAPDFKTEYIPNGQPKIETSLPLSGTSSSGYVPPETYKNKADAFNDLKNNYIVIQDARKTISGRGWPAVDEVDVVGLLKLFITAKAKMDDPPDEIKRHFKNWIFREPLNNLTDLASKFKKSLA